MRDNNSAHKFFRESIVHSVNRTNHAVSVPSEENRAFEFGKYLGQKGPGLFNRCKLDTETGCWNWTGSTQTFGYGQMTFRGKHMLVHRVAAIIWLKFEPSSGLDVLHRCDNRICFNPKHLFFGTDYDNIHDMMAKGRDNFRGRGPAKTHNLYRNKKTATPEEFERMRAAVKLLEPKPESVNA